jgi:hypothetical protein
MFVRESNAKKNNSVQRDRHTLYMRPSNLELGMSITPCHLSSSVASTNIKIDGLGISSEADPIFCSFR